MENLINISKFSLRLNGKEYKPKESPPADYFAITRELKEIGSNMNQIAFMADATGLVDDAAYYENVIQPRDALRRIEMAA